MLEKKVLSQFLESIWKYKDDQKAEPYLLSILEHLENHYKQTKDESIRKEIDKFLFYRILRKEGYSEERAKIISSF